MPMNPLPRRAAGLAGLLVFAMSAWSSAGVAEGRVQSATAVSQAPRTWALLDVWPATFLYLLSFWGVMIPTGYVIGVLEERGAPGLMVAVLVSTACALVLLGIRFYRVTRRALKRA